MTRKLMTGTAMATVLAIAPAAFAQDGNPSGGNMSVQTVNDCFISSPTEAGASAQQHFDALDRDGNGRITQQEYLNCLSDHGVDVTGQTRDAWLVIYDDVDEDGDDAIVLAEYEAASTGSGMAETRERERRQAMDAQQQRGQQQAGGQQDATRQVAEAEEGRVRVEQAAPEVEVEQAEPEVRVRQAQPEVIVEQPEPEITVNMPEPRVTVRQPEPEVAVNQPSPDVDVRQPEPEVTVDPAEPEVVVRQPQPDVEVEERQAEVQVSEAEAEVEIDQAEPDVAVRTVTEPDVNVEGGDEGRQGEQRMAQADTGAAEQMEEAGRAGDEGEMRDGERQAADRRMQDDGAMQDGRETARLDYEWLMDQSVFNTNGEEIGDVEEILLDPETRKPVVVVSIGGFLGIGDTELVFDYDRFERSAEGLILDIASTEEAMAGAPEYDEARYENLPSDMRQ